jgi:Zn-dependent protease with chaperone function
MKFLLHFGLSLLLLLNCQNTSAQLSKPYYIHADLIVSSNLKQKWNTTSENVRVFEVVYNDDELPSYAVCVRPNQQDSEILVPMTTFPFAEIQPANLNAFWVLKAMQTGLYLQDLQTSKEQLIKRNELLRRIQAANFGKFYETKVDPYSQAYLSGLLNKLVPKKIQDGRNILFRVKLNQSIEPNAHAFADGTIVISSGLLSIMSSENELICVLAHEVAHVVLGHSLSKKIYNMETVEKQYSQYMRELMEKHEQGILLSYGEQMDLWINIQRIWINNYSRQLEAEADRIALDFLKFSGISECYALKMFQSLKKQEDLIQGWYAHVYNDPDNLNSTHPSLEDRIKQIKISNKDCSELGYDHKYNQWVNPIARMVSLYEFLWTLNNSQYSTNEKLSHTIELMDSISKRTQLPSDYAILIEMLCKIPGYETLLQSKFVSYKNSLSKSTAPMDQLVFQRIHILSNLYLGNTNNSDLIAQYKKSISNLPNDQTINHPFISSKQTELDWINGL